MKIEAQTEGGNQTEVTHSLDNEYIDRLGTDKYPNLSLIQLVKINLGILDNEERCTEYMTGRNPRIGGSVSMRVHTTIG